MTRKPVYILDTNVFITAKISYYSFDICPGFWDSLIYHYQNGDIRSIDKVKDELLEEKDKDLYEWINDKIPSDFFLSSADQNIRSNRQNIMSEVRKNTQYFDFAKDRFAKGADSWLIAHAMENEYLIVTNEETAPDSKKSIKIPDVCKKFTVTCLSPFAMLSNLRTRYHFLTGTGI